VIRYKRIEVISSLTEITIFGTNAVLVLGIFMDVSKEPTSLDFCLDPED
jgi:hypothetical protein